MLYHLNLGISPFNNAHISSRSLETKDMDESWMFFYSFFCLTPIGLRLDFGRLIASELLFFSCFLFFSPLGW